MPIFQLLHKSFSFRFKQVKKRMILRNVCTAFIALSCCLQALHCFASHVAGSEISYSCTGIPHQFTIRCSFYRDCNGIPAPASISVTCTSASCDTTFTATLAQIPCPPFIPPATGSGCEISVPCPDFARLSCCDTLYSNCYPGIQRYIYEGIITFSRFLQQLDC
jgi:hypothetical protein